MPQALDEVQTYLDNLMTARQRAWHEAQELLATAKKEEREFVADEQAKWDKIMADIDEKDERATEFADRIKSEREGDTLREEWREFVRPEAAGGDKQAQADLAAFETWVRSGGRAEGNADTPNKRGWEFDLAPVARERRALRAGVRGQELRDLSVGTAAAGGNTVPTDFLRRLYDFIEAASGMRRTNATILSTAGGENLQLPTVTAHGTAAIVGEGTALAEADAAFGQVTLGAFKYGQLAQISNELLSDTGVDILGFLARDCGRALGRVTGTAYVRGSGSNAPHGFGIRAGTATTIQTGSTGVPSYNDLVTVVYSVIEEYRQNGAAWVMADSFEGAIRKLTDTQGRPLWQPVVMAGEPDMLLGYPVINDRNMTAAGTAAGTPMFFGDYEPFYIRDAGQIRFERSDEFAFSSDTVTFRSIMRTDSDLIDLTGCAKKVLAPST